MWLSDVEIHTETRNVINDWAQLGLMMAGIFMCSHVQMLLRSSPSWRPLSWRHDVMPIIILRVTVTLTSILW